MEKEFLHCSSRWLPETDKFNVFAPCPLCLVCFKFWIFVSPTKVSVIAFTVAALITSLPNVKQALALG